MYSDTESTECHFKPYKIVELFVVMETELEVSYMYVWSSLVKRRHVGEQTGLEAKSP